MKQKSSIIFSEMPIRRRALMLISISAIFIGFLLSWIPPVVATETIDFAAGISVVLPGPVSGNPGEFLTLILTLRNLGTQDITLDVQCESDHQWSVLYDTQFMVPGGNASLPGETFVPMTVLIPPDAPPATEMIRLRISKPATGESSPTIQIPVTVSPVSDLEFMLPPPGQALLGTTHAYKVIVVNTGNQEETINLSVTSENAWIVKVEPSTFTLSPGKTGEVKIEHYIPDTTSTREDMLQLNFSWKQNEKSFFLPTYVTDVERLADRYYLWQGEWNVGVTNNLSPYDQIRLEGEFAPDSYAEFHAYNLFGKDDSRWQLELEYDDWELEIGKFPLVWTGLTSPLAGWGSFHFEHEERKWALYGWEKYSDEMEVGPFGFEIGDDHSNRFRYLYEPKEEDDQSIIEFDFKIQPFPGVEWENIMSLNLLKPQYLGYANYFRGRLGDWRLTGGHKFFLNEGPADSVKHDIWSTWQKSDSKSFTEIALKYNTLVTDLMRHDMWKLSTLHQSPSGLYLNLTQECNVQNNEFYNAFTTIYLGSKWKKLSSQHQWDINLSYKYENKYENDNSSLYSKINWSTVFNVTPRMRFLLKPELVVQIPNSDYDYFRLGLGYEDTWRYGLIFNSILYTYIAPDPGWYYDVGVSWKKGSHEFQIKSTGEQIGNDMAPECDFIFSYSRQIGFPAPKPMGTLHGKVFLDNNQNGVWDEGEKKLGQVEFILDGSQTFRSDETGDYQITMLTPGSHKITLNTAFETTYILPEEIMVNTKPYQNILLDIPLQFSQNLCGIVYRDLNRNQIQDDGESGIPSIVLVLTEKSGTIGPEKKVTDQNGVFVFYRLELFDYALSLDSEVISEEWQLGLQEKIIDLPVALRNQLADPITVGLMPVPRQIEFVNVPQKIVDITLVKEFVKPGDKMEILMEFREQRLEFSLDRITMELPGDQIVPIEIREVPARWSYQWSVPDLAPGHYTIKCVMVDKAGKSITEEVRMMILQ